MNTKEAIEWIRTLTNCLNYPANFNFKKPEELAENNQRTNNVIKLLKEGENIKKMYEKEIELNY